MTLRIVRSDEASFSRDSSRRDVVHQARQLLNLDSSLQLVRIRRGA